MLNVGPYSKAVTAVAGQALTYASLYYGGNHWVAAAVAVAAALGVYAVPNAAPAAPLVPGLRPDTPGDSKTPEPAVLQPTTALIEQRGGAPLDRR